MTTLYRIRQWPDPYTLTDIESIKEYLKRVYVELQEESAMRPEDLAYVLGDVAKFAFKTITGITNNVVADALDDTLTLASGNALLSIVGTTVSDTITFTVNNASIDHGTLAGLADNDHPQYLRLDTSNDPLTEGLEIIPNAAYSGLTITMANATFYGITVDGATTDYTSAVPGITLDLTRDLNRASNLGNYAGIQNYVNPKHTTATMSGAGTSDIVYGAINRIDNDATITHTEAIARTYTEYGSYDWIDNNGFIDTSSTGLAGCQYIGIKSIVDHATTYTDTGATSPATYSIATGLEIDLDDTPTLTSGALTHTAYGVYMDVASNATGTSTAYGIYINDVSGADNNYAVYDGSGELWQLGSSALTTTGIITGNNFISSIAIGTSPYACTSTTLNTNLNADLLDGSHAAAFSPLAGSASIVTVGTITSGTWQGGVIADAYIANDITLTNITQITNRSHTSLSDIGTLSHATIDTYLDQAVKTTSEPLFVTVRIKDSDASNFLYLRWNEDQSMNPILDFVTGASNRQITLSGNPTLADWFDQAVKQASSPTFVGGTFSGLTASVPVVTSAGSALTSQTYANFKTSLVLAQADISGLTTASSPVFVTAKLSGLTDGYIPYHVADNTGLANSNIFYNATNVGIGTTSPTGNLHVYSNKTTPDRNTADIYMGSYTDGKAFGWMAVDQASVGTFLIGIRQYGIGFGNIALVPDGGNVGIGTTDIEAWSSPTIEFTTTALNSGGTNGLYLASNVYNDGAYKYKTTAVASFSGSENGEFRVYTAASGTINTACTLTERFEIDNAGDCWTNDGGVHSLSDESVKVKTKDFKYGLQEILTLTPAMFRHNHNIETKHPISDDEFVGLIAQDVQAVIPEAVKKTEDGYLGMTNMPIMYAMLNAIKELTARIESLEKKNA